MLRLTPLSRSTVDTLSITLMPLDPQTRQLWDAPVRLLHALMAITLACAAVVALFLDAPRSQTLQTRMP